MHTTADRVHKQITLQRDEGKTHNVRVRTRRHDKQGLFNNQVLRTRNDVFTDTNIWSTLSRRTAHAVYPSHAVNTHFWRPRKKTTSTVQRSAPRNRERSVGTKHGSTADSSLQALAYNAESIAKQQSTHTAYIQHLDGKPHHDPTTNTL